MILMSSRAVPYAAEARIGSPECPVGSERNGKAAKPRKIDTVRVDGEQLGGVDKTRMTADRRWGFALVTQIR